jgi:hypothetical protein
LELKLSRPKCSGTHQTRLRCVFRREGVCVDRSAITLDTSTESRSPEHTYGRFSFSGPCRLAHKMAVRDTSLACTPSRVKTYPKGSGHFSATTRVCQARQGHLRAHRCCAPCPHDHNPSLPSRLGNHPAERQLANPPFPILKPASASLTIRPTHCAAIENPSSIQHEFVHRLRAPRARRFLPSTKSPKT